MAVPGGDDSGEDHHARREHDPQESLRYTISRERKAIHNHKVTSAIVDRECQWFRSAVERLRILRSQGHGLEPMWLGVLHRIRYRADDGYYQWCKQYLKQLRAEFSSVLQYQLYTAPLTPSEIAWARDVEHACFQDYVAAGFQVEAGARDPIQHVEADTQILANTAYQAASASSCPQGLFQAVWVDTATSTWGPTGTEPPAHGDTPRAARDDLGRSRSPQRPCNTNEADHAPTSEADDDSPSLFQLSGGLETVWERLMERFWGWFEEGRAVGMAVQMVRGIAGERGDSQYRTWVHRPLHTLSAGIPAAEGVESGLTPLDFRSWAEAAERVLHGCFLRDREQGSLQLAGQNDAVSLMEDRYRHGRRRIRDSRSPRRARRSSGARTPATGRSRASGEAAPSSAAGSGRARAREEYVTIRLDEAPSASEPASGSRGTRPVDNDVLPNLSQPITQHQAVCLWRHLLFDRTAFDYSSSSRSQIPASFLPLSTLREVSVAHEAMCPQNRLASTVAFMTVMRYLMSEIAQTLEVAEAIARTNEGTQEAEDMDEGDAANLMQRTVKETVSDGHRQRWTRALARLQKELAGQGTGARWEHIRRLRQGLAGCADPRHEWCEQLEALLLAMQGEETEARGDDTMDPQWISGWFGELGVLLQGFGLPVLVESQTETQGSLGGILGMDAQLLSTRSDTQPRDGTSAEKEHDFEMHLRDEQEARADRELRDRELADYQAQQEEFERLKAQELCILQEQAREYQAQEDRLMAEALGRPAKRRCVVSLELATGSGDKPKVLHTLSAEVPEDGGSLTLVMRASFEPEADTVSTIGVPSPSREAAAGGGQSQGVPEATLSQLDFHEFEFLYSEWRAGKKSSKDIAQQYGNDVVELLEAQKAVTAVEDEEHDNGPGHGLEGGIFEVIADALGSQGDSPTYETSAMMAPGQPRIRFALFESIYGQWKAGWRSDEAVQRGLSPLWLHLFRLWRVWGLEAIEPYLGQELDMRKDPSPDEPAPLISDQGEARAVPVVPLSCVMVTFVAWCRGELTDAQVQGLQGDAWLLRFRQLRETGLQGVAMVLGKEVLWDVSEGYVQQQAEGLHLWAGIPRPSALPTSTILAHRLNQPRNTSNMGHLSMWHTMMVIEVMKYETTELRMMRYMKAESESARDSCLLPL